MNKTSLILGNGSSFNYTVSSPLSSFCHCLQFQSRFHVHIKHDICSIVYMSSTDYMYLHSWNQFLCGIYTSSPTVLDDFVGMTLMKSDPYVMQSDTSGSIFNVSIIASMKYVSCDFWHIWSFPLLLNAARKDWFLWREISRRSLSWDWPDINSFANSCQSSLSIFCFKQIPEFDWRHLVFLDWLIKNVCLLVLAVSIMYHA